MSKPFQVFVFHSNHSRTIASLDGGVDGVVVDWEFKGKNERQLGYDTQVNCYNESDIGLLRETTDKPIICRINGGKHFSAEEIHVALEAGASEILLPMVTRLDEIEKALSAINGKAKLDVMIETEEAVTLAAEIGKLPLYRVYVGLNDLSISRGTSNIFLPLVDGTLEHVRTHIPMDLGVAGLTHPEGGRPLPCRLLMKIMAKFNLSFSFLRRSFYKDIETYGASEIICAIKSEMAILTKSKLPKDDHKELKERILRLWESLI